MKRYALRAVGFTLIASLGYTVTDFCIQFLVRKYTLFQVFFMVVVTSMLTLLACMPFPALRRRIIRKNETLKIHNWKAHVLIGLLGFAADGCAFFSFRGNSLGLVYALLLSVPLFSALISLIFFKEKFNRWKTGALFFGFGASVLIANPSFSFAGVASLSLLLASLSAMFFSVLFFIFKYYAEHENVTVLFLSSRSISFLLLVPAVVYFWEPMTLNHLLLSALSGVGFFLGFFFILYATRLGTVVMVTSLQYTQLLMALLVDFLLYSLFPSWLTIVSSFVIVACCLIMIRQGIHMETAEHHDIDHMEGPFIHQI